MPADTAGYASSTKDFDAVTLRMIPLKKLSAAEEELRVLFHAGKPSRHAFIDNFFAPDILDRLVADFPGQKAPNFRKDRSSRDIILSLGNIVSLSAFTQTFLMQTCSGPMMEFLRHVTGYQDLVPDPLFHASGLVEVFRGSVRSLSTEPLQHPLLPLVCRVRLVIYLNRDWDPAWGGALTLSDPAGRTTANMVPIFNRVVLFETGAGARYGITDPVCCPAGRSRRSLVVSYWNAPD